MNLLNLRYVYILSSSFGPSVKLLLEKYGLEPKNITPGGPGGRILKGDVLNLVKMQNLQPKPIEAGK